MRKMLDDAPFDAGKGAKVYIYSAWTGALRIFDPLMP
jgi:hypothetical protein